MISCYFYAHLLNYLHCFGTDFGAKLLFLLSETCVCVSLWSTIISVMLKALVSFSSSVLVVVDALSSVCILVFLWLKFLGVLFLHLSFGRFSF